MTGDMHVPHPKARKPLATKMQWFKPTLSTWIVGGIVVLFLLMATLSAGIPGLLIFLGLIGAVTAIYTAVTGRHSWASIPSRKVAGLALAASVVVLMSGGIVGAATAPTELTAQVEPTARATPSPKPTRTATPAPEFTDESAKDPSTVTAPTESTAVFVSDTTTTSDTTALALLATIAVKGKAPKTGYDRSGMFGSAWLDADRNGCDTRNDILSRDLTETTKAGTCRVLSGQLISPFTSATIDFVRGNDTSALVQIDHVVSLSNAWQTGAQQLTQSQRISLANDPINLLAVDGRSNALKGDGDTATWLPSNKEFRCAYVARQVSVKATYGLWITVAEHDAISKVLSTCTTEPALTSPFTPAPAPAPAPVVVVTPPVAVVVPLAPAPAAPAPAAPAPAAPAPVPVAPAPAPAAPATVHPGSYCSSAGATGVTVKGTPMVCKTTAEDSRLRWRSA